MRILSILLLFIFSLPALAQEVTNVNVRQDGTNIVISYDLNKRADVSLYYKSSENNEPIRLNYVYGDVGNNIPSGSKVIVWKVLEEFDRFIENDVQFIIVAEKTYKQKIRELKNSKIYPWAGADVFMGYEHATRSECGLVMGLTAYFSWNYQKPHRWGMVADLYMGLVHSSWGINVGASCMLTPQVCMFAAPGIGLIDGEVCPSFHLGAGISFYDDLVIATLHLSYPYFVGLGLGLTLDPLLRE